MATNPFNIPAKKQQKAYKNPFGVNIQNTDGNDNGIYNPTESGWGNEVQIDGVENFPVQFGNNNNQNNNNSFNNQQFQKQPAVNGFDNKNKQKPPKQANSSNPFAFNPNTQFSQDTQQSNLDMNFSMDNTSQNNYQQYNQQNSFNKNSNQPKRFDPNQAQQQQQTEQYSDIIQRLGFDPNNVDPDNEPPLLVELGIDLQSIKARTLSVLKFRKCETKFLEDPDMSGPVILGFLFGFLLLLSGKMHFGYVYGFGISGTIAIYFIMNFLSMHKQIPLYNTLSILGYCLMPVIILSFINVFMSLKGLTGSVLATLSILWSTFAATNFFNELIHQEHQKYLVAYPVLLFYSMFVLLTIF